MADLTYDDVLELARKLIPVEQARLLSEVADAIREQLETAEPYKGHHPEGDDVITDEELRELVANLGKQPMTGHEIIEAGLAGGLEDLGITDSVEWLEKRRAMFESKLEWHKD